MLLVMLLFGASESINASAALAGRVAFKGVINSADNVAASAFKGVVGLTDNMAMGAKGFIDDFVRAGGSKASGALDNLTSSLKSLGLADDFAADLTASIGKESDNLVTATDDILASTIKNASGVTDDVASKMVGSMDDATKAALLNGDAALDDLAGIFKKFGGDSFTVLDDAGKAVTMTADDVGSKMVGQLDDLASNVSKLGGFADDVGAISRLAGKNIKNVGKMTGKEFDAMMDDVGKGMGKTQRAHVKQLFSESQNMFASIKGITKRAANKINKRLTGGKGVFSPEQAAKARRLDDTILTSNSLDDVAKATKELKVLNRSIRTFRQGTMHNVYKVGKQGMTFVMYAGGILSAAVLFMIPALFQSSFVAEQHQNAMLQTYIPPVKFGDVVVQLPDSVVNMGDASLSQFVYYGIPVKNPGDKVSDAAKAAYPGISGATNKNKVSKGVSNGYAQAFTMAKKISIPRYNLNAEALSTLPIYVSFSEQSWEEWGDSGIPDAAFSQTLINLNTGYMFYADGTAVDGPSTKLVGPKHQGKSVQ